MQLVAGFLTCPEIGGEKAPENLSDIFQLSDNRMSTERLESRK